MSGLISFPEGQFEYDQSRTPRSFRTSTRLGNCGCRRPKDPHDLQPVLLEKYILIGRTVCADCQPKHKFRPQSVATILKSERRRSPKAFHKIIGSALLDSLQNRPPANTVNYMTGNSRKSTSANPTNGVWSHSMPRKRPNHMPFRCPSAHG